MKKNTYKNLLMTGVVLTTLGFASCSNELNEADFNNTGNNTIGSSLAEVTLVKSPDVVAWSGNQTLGSTLNGGVVYATRSIYVSGNAGDGSMSWDGYNSWAPFNVPANITEDEKAGVLDALSQKVTGRRISEELVLPWKNYFLQDVVSAVETDTPSKSYEFEAYNKGAKCNQQYYPGYDFEDYSQVTNSGQINSYYQYQNKTPQERIDKTALMANMQNGTYEEMKGKQFRWFVNCHENLHWYEYIFVEYNGNYYICFDFACGHAENDVDGNSGRGNTQNDWDYNDWIIKISPAVGSDNPDEEFPVWAKTPEEGSDEPTEEPKDEEVTDSPLYHNDEIEVNYAILDEHADYDVADLVTKLSIHVRKATNVDIKIPVPTHYLVESDDLYIFKEHFIDGDGNGNYGGNTNPLKNQNATLTYVVDGNTVTLNVQFMPGDASLGSEFANGYIHVYTEGINQAVIDACWEYNNDGINFEIFNYFQTSQVVWNENEGVSNVVKIEEINRQDLLEAMNHSVIEFENEPSYYINAFGYGFENGASTGMIHGEHAVVKPVATEGYKAPYRTYHLNSTPWNDIYVHESVTEPDHLHSDKGTTDKVD